MVSLTNIGIGSIVLNMVESVPTYISGATLWNMADNEIYFAEQVTGDTIGTSISEKYQPGIISLTTASVLRMMEMRGADVSSMKIGDFSIKKGAGGATVTTAVSMRQDGIQKLEALGERTSYYKALG